MKLLTKLNIKTEKAIYILNDPDEFRETKEEISKILTVLDSPSDMEMDAVLTFVYNCKDIEKYAEAVLSNVSEDGLVWFAYPKKSSKKYKSDVGRDNGWEPIGKHQYEPVRQVAIDEDWSALRFRHVKDIKRLTRTKKNAISSEGKIKSERTTKKEEMEKSQ